MTLCTAEGHLKKSSMSFSSNLETKLFRYFSCTPYKLRMLSTSIGFRGRGRRHTGTYIHTYIHGPAQTVCTYVHTHEASDGTYTLHGCIHTCVHAIVHVRTTSTCCAGYAMGGRSRQGNSCCTHQWTSTHLNLICALGQCLSILPPFLLHSTHTYTRYMCCCYVCISISFIGLWSHLRHSYDVTRS